MSSRLPRALLHCKISHFALPVVLWMGTSDDGVRPSHSGSPAALHQDVIGFSTAALTVPLCLLIGRSGEDTGKQGLQAQWGACQATLFWLGRRSPIGDVCNESACWPTICYVTRRSQCLNTMLVDHLQHVHKLYEQNCGARADSCPSHTLLVWEPVIDGRPAGNQGTHLADTPSPPGCICLQFLLLKNARIVRSHTWHIPHVN